MWMLLVIGFLIPLVYIGHLMSKLDKFLEKGGFKIEDDEICPVAIVLGTTDIAKQIIDILHNNTIPILILAEPFLLEKEQSFRYLFALSESDMDNMVLCKIGKKVYNVEKIISLCNDRKNEGMFMSEKIRYMPRENITAQMIYQSVMQ
ncbi:hypothetical protein [Clostridium sp.]|uniref:hypothetical protein n=1 Tax=Clostridium sp. TaxID=1506 RepID=UPI001A4AAC8D|nr:hypothetical protein [Clostridium sp.]MBK5236558.1 hypothetical protein [Clostridium sp.]